MGLDGKLDHIESLIDNREHYLMSANSPTDVIIPTLESDRVRVVRHRIAAVDVFVLSAWCGLAAGLLEVGVAEYLGNHGYATAGFVVNLGYCSQETGLARGFTHYFFCAGYPNVKRRAVPSLHSSIPLTFISSTYCLREHGGGS